MPKKEFGNLHTACDDGPEQGDVIDRRVQSYLPLSEFHLLVQQSHDVIGPTESDRRSEYSQDLVVIRCGDESLHA